MCIDILQLDQQLEPLPDLNNSHTAPRLRPRLEGKRASSQSAGESENKNNNSASSQALAKGKTWRQELVSKAKSKEDAKKNAASGEAVESDSSTSFRREFCLPPI